ncbi:hypothetical protein P0Y67_07915 [Photobacterium sp. SP02]|uniref:hypothetical protein n=1 Tax=Photobacterium sp. SP02 TaxID=3032280 RepID=UPI0031456023
MNARNECEAAQQSPSPTNGHTVRLSLHGMHLALSELITVVREQPDNTVIYRERDIKESGIWRYILDIDQAFKIHEASEAKDRCICESIVEISPSSI